MSNINLSEIIANKIKRKIISGEYGLGKQLPNEQELCDSLNVSRTTVREAIKLLVSKNVLQIERGKGTFVAAVPGLSEDPFGLEFVRDDILKSDLCAFRSIVEPKICRMAAQNATAEQMDSMDKQIIKMQEIAGKAHIHSAEEWIDEFIDQEIDFHILLYKMSGNVLFERMHDLISRSVVINCTEFKYRQSFDFIKYTDIHASLYNAIVARDAEAAEQIGKEHCLSFDLYVI